MSQDDAYARLAERLDRLEARLAEHPPATTETATTEVGTSEAGISEAAASVGAAPDHTAASGPGSPSGPAPLENTASPDNTASPQNTATEIDDVLPAELFWALKGLKERESAPAVLYTGVVRLPGQPGPVEWQMGHYVEDLLAEDWSDRATALSALGHPVRLQILQLIARGEAKTAAELAATDGLGTTGQVYHHLKQLVSAGWLRSAARGTHLIPPERLVPLLVLLGASQ